MPPVKQCRPDIVRTGSGQWGWKFTDEVYNQRWVARVKSNSVIDAANGCWLWKGFLHPIWGYGQTNYRGRPARVHRQMYKVIHGVQLTREQYVCHSCDVRHCCNPDHLWLGSNSENQKDSSAKARHYESRRSHCESGHEFTPENTYLRRSKSGGTIRVCSECQRLKSRVRSRIKKGWSLEDALSTPPLPIGTARPGKKMGRPRVAILTT